MQGKEVNLLVPHAASSLAEELGGRRSFGSKDSRLGRTWALLMDTGVPEENKYILVFPCGPPEVLCLPSMIPGDGRNGVRCGPGP